MRAELQAGGGSGWRSRAFAVLHNEHGSIATMFALTVFIVFGFVGSAIDFARVYRARSAIQSGIDTATLAGARAKQLGGTDTDAIAAANAYLSPIKQKLGLAGSIEFSVADNGSTLIGSALIDVPTMFLKVVGMEKLSFQAAGAATFGAGSNSQTNVELVMMLDTTGSMQGQKIADLRSAAQDLVDIVVSDNQSGATSRVGVVPFSIAVKLDKNTFEAATGRTWSGAYKGCVVERTGADAYTDATPAAAAFVMPLEDKAPGYACNSIAQIMPLTDKKAELKQTISTLTAGGSTAGHLGTAWAWYLLSPKWASSVDQPNTPAPYSDITATNPDGSQKLRKIAVLMTDGAYNTQYSNVDSTTQARNLCTEMKKTGIVVYTVGFQLGGDAVATETLQGCASDPTKFYDATTGDALKAAFRDIALKAAPLRLSR